MATQHNDNEEYSNSPGGLNIVWYKENYFYMLVTLPYDISPYSFEAEVTDKLGNTLAAMTLAVTASGPVLGTISCAMEGIEIDALPSNSYWYFDQIDNAARHTTLLGGLFTVREKGDA